PEHIGRVIGIPRRGAILNRLELQDRRSTDFIAARLDGPPPRSHRLCVPAAEGRVAKSRKGRRKECVMQCPIDKVDLVMTERQGIEIDYCPKCRGVWLDRGELDKIIERSAEAVPPPPRPQYQQPT